MGNEKRSICFATLMSNELNSDVARFTTHEKNLATLFAARHVRKKVVKRATMLQNKLHVFC